jgi:hypothetical protein
MKAGGADLVMAVESRCGRVDLDRSSDRVLLDSLSSPGSMRRVCLLYIYSGFHGYLTEWQVTFHEDPAPEMVHIHSKISTATTTTASSFALP